MGAKSLVRHGPDLQRHLATVEVVESPDQLALSALAGHFERLVTLAEELSLHRGSAICAQVGQLDRSAGDGRVRELDASPFALRAHVELVVQA